MRNLKIYAMGLLFSLLMAGVAVGGTRDPNTPDEKYVEFGKQFPSVVKIKAEIHTDELVINGVKVTNKNGEPAGKMYQHASAVIIRPHWILTAAHVVTDTKNQVVESAGQEFPLEFVIRHPEYQEDNYGFYDLALGYSPQDFKLAFYTPLYDTDDELGKHITVAGYGFSGTFHTGAQKHDGQRRAGSNVISRIERGVLVCDASRTGKTALEFLICSGDSGGGMFIGDRLAGINSFLLAIDKKPNGTYTDEAAFTRISLYTDWVKSQVEKHEQLQILNK